MNPFAKLDASLLHGADAVVLWAWNRFSLPRIVLIRSAFVVWVVGRGTLTVAEGQVTAWTVLWLLAMLFVGAVEEFQAARYPPRMLNARILATRTGPLDTIIRWFAITLPFRIYDEFLVLDLAASLAASAFFILCQSVTPEDPPKRRKPATVLKAKGALS